MRIDEIASAEDQIALFKLITDKVWQAIADQQRIEANAKARQAEKSKPRTQSSPKVAAPTSTPAPRPRAPKAKSNASKTSSVSRSMPRSPQLASVRPESNVAFSSSNGSFDSKSLNPDGASDI